MNKKLSFMGDFETSVYEGQESTEVWAWALTPIEGEVTKDSVTVGNSMEGFFDFLFKLGKNATVYFHNLKWDGMFIMHHLATHGEFTEYTYREGGETKLHDRKDFRFACSGSYIYSVSDKGQWYSITLKWRGHDIVFQDSLKLLPFSVKAIGKAFKTTFQKTEIEYKGERHGGGYISPEEEDYIKNDVLVVKEALQIMFAQGHTKMTIGANCLHDYKATTWHDDKEFRAVFPDLIEEDCPVPGFDNADAYIRKSYHGGYCYLNRHHPAYAGVKDIAREGVVIDKPGITCDVNSLYPSVMLEESGNAYPYGRPKWFFGEIPPEATATRPDGSRKYYYFVRFSCRFKVRDGFLPTVQIKGSPYYSGREWLETSDYVDREGVAHAVVTGLDGEEIRVKPTLTMTGVDFELFQKHYEVTELTIFDGCYFATARGMFDDYIKRWAKVKMESTGALRALAKLFLNNLYGKFASSDNSDYKVFHFDDLKKAFYMSVVEAHEKTPGYIPVGSAITSYARYFTITCAQKNFIHFLYADTDSIHCDCGAGDIVGAPRDDVKFLHWKYEATWDRAIFARQKTYIEHVTEENGIPCDPYYNVKCAGMGKGSRETFIKWLESGEKRMEDFKVGLSVPNNLKSYQLNGGVVLLDVEYKLR